MSAPFHDKSEERIYESGITEGYENAQSEWLGFLRTEKTKLEELMSKSVDNSDLYVACYHRIEGIKYLIQERWHTEVIDG